MINMIKPLCIWVVMGARKSIYLYYHYQHCLVVTRVVQLSIIIENINYKNCKSLPPMIMPYQGT